MKVLIFRSFSLIVCYIAIFLINVNANFRTIANFTSNYAAIIDYYDSDETIASPMLKFTLLYEKLPITLEDNGGMWLGIGFGKLTMLGTDLVICEWDDL